ncbi:Ldh family oxidoreductase, partial [Candidatus Pseudothioglobus singularis]|nr:Ldh family oxidoreductase [Candidatus Pseudothioglobus singularis]
MFFILIAYDFFIACYHFFVTWLLNSLYLAIYLPEWIFNKRIKLMTSTTTELNLDEIFNLAKAALINNGANEENADAVATTVTNAERDGSVSHGLFRIPGYVK